MGDANATSPDGGLPVDTLVVRPDVISNPPRYQMSRRALSFVWMGFRDDEQSAADFAFTLTRFRAPEAWCQTAQLWADFLHRLPKADAISPASALRCWAAGWSLATCPTTGPWWAWAWWPCAVPWGPGSHCAKAA